MSEECDHEHVLALFASRRWQDRTNAIAEALIDSHADALLAQMLGSARFADNVEIAVQLGDLHGDPGTAALLRSAHTTGPGTRDLRCASLLALAKRCGEEATPWLRDALADRDGAVKDYAVVGLAGAGDDRAWDEVAARLVPLIRRQRRALEQPEIVMAIAYLARHLGSPDRRRRLVEFVRRNWASVAEPAWFAIYWPDVRPDGPPVEQVEEPDADALRAWARSPLFAPALPPVVP